jgi:hypothetical protein
MQDNQGGKNKWTTNPVNLNRLPLKRSGFHEISHRPDFITDKNCDSVIKSQVEKHKHKKCYP